MAKLLNEILWDEPILPLVADPPWEEEVKRARGSVPDVVRRIAPSPWLRHTFLLMDQYKPLHVPARLLHIAALVTAQENACRYCYGAARAQMTMLGYSGALIGRIERESQVAELDEKERAVIRFCRALARSNPRPAYLEREELMRLGYSKLAVTELAYLIAGGCFINRVATLIACPPEYGFEKLAGGFLGRMIGLAAPLVLSLGALRKRAPEAQPTEEELTVAGPFGPIAQALAGLPAAAVMQDAMAGAFAASVLPRRTKALMFAVVARSLDCQFCLGETHRLLLDEEFSGEQIDACLVSLASPLLEPYESRIIAWVRDTVRYEPQQIQRSTRALRDEIGAAALLDAVGVAALANAVVRLAMVLE